MGIGPELDGKVAVVTGAAGGIGHAVASHLVELGATVYGWDIVSPETPAGSFSRVDISDADSITRALGEVVDNSGPPHIVVNSAAVLVSGSLYEVTEADFLSALTVNVLGTFLVTKIVTASMNVGSVINFASVAGRVSAPDTAAYASTKGAVESFTVSIAGTLAKRGIRVNAVLPGWIDGGFTTRLLDTVEDPQAIYDQASAAHLLGRMGSPFEVAKVVAFLASDQSSFLTGTILPVDGGFLIAK